jgi:hypothetical protein
LESWGMVVDTRHLVGFVHEGWVDGAAAKQWVVCPVPMVRKPGRPLGPAPAKVQLPGQPSRQHDQ